MSVTIEKKEHNMAVLTIEVPAEEFDRAMNEAWQKSRGRINVPGFRKGKAPRKMIERVYGAGVFYEDAANIVIPKAYDENVKEVEETIVSRPQIDITQIEAGKPFIFTAEVALKPEVILGEYKGVEVEAEPVVVTDEEVTREIDRERESNSRVIDIDDRPVEDGDMIRLNFDGSVDGAAFEGGKAEDYSLTIGSGSFIPGFEEQLIGMKAGEEKDVRVTFPEDYHAEDLKGKEAVFACKVNAIQRKELPEADDEFAQDVSEFDTLEEYKQDIVRRLTEEKEAAARRAKENAVVAKIGENAQIDIPEAMVADQVSRMMDDFANRMQYQGITMEQYMQITGMDREKLAQQMRPEAMTRIRNSLVLEAVAAAENIEISDERVSEEIAKMAESYKMEADKLSELMGEEEKAQLRADLAVSQAARLVADAAKEVPKKDEAVDIEE